MKNILMGLKRTVGQKKVQMAMLLYAILAPIGIAGAAEAKWNAVIDFIVPWITRMGGLIVLIGAVEFGIAFKGDDAEGKTRGIRTIVAGCIVTAVGLSSNIFLA